MTSSKSSRKNTGKEISKYDELTKSEKERLLAIYQARAGAQIHMYELGLILVVIGIALLGVPTSIFPWVTKLFLAITYMIGGFVIVVIIGLWWIGGQVTSIEESLETKSILRKIRS